MMSGKPPGTDRASSGDMQNCRYKTRTSLCVSLLVRSWYWIVYVLVSLGKTWLKK